MNKQKLQMLALAYIGEQAQHGLELMAIGDWSDEDAECFKSWFVESDDVYNWLTGRFGEDEFEPADCQALFGWIQEFVGH